MDLALTLDEAAVQAARQASRAAAELLQYFRDGPHSGVCAFESDVTGMLAEALKLTLEIEDTPQAKAFMDAEELALHANLQAAVGEFIAGWMD